MKGRKVVIPPQAIHSKEHAVAGGGVPGTMSIVIPVLNEAHHLLELLPRLARQSLRPLEVLVADANSSDGSRKVARRLGATVISGGRPAAGRTAGALAAEAEWVCFLDADTRLPDDAFLERALRDVVSQGLAAAVADNRASYRPGDRGFHRWWIRAWDRFLLGSLNSGQRGWLRAGFPVGQAVFMLVRRDVFLDVGGFDPSAEPYEDSELLLKIHRRIAPEPGRSSSVGVLSPPLHVLISTRRWDVKGRLWFPVALGLRGSLLRWLFRKELPIPAYWDVNARGDYVESPVGEDKPGDTPPGH